jgi:hypothetical protein
MQDSWTQDDIEGMGDWYDESQYGILDDQTLARIKQQDPAVVTPTTHCRECGSFRGGQNSRVTGTLFQFRISRRMKEFV